jgi:DNA repair exonuclease SbcCD ATPase subunit
LSEQAAGLAPELQEAPETFQDQLEQADRECDGCQNALQEAARNEARLRQDSERYRDLSAEIKQADRQRHLWNRLALLTGPDVLQRHLLGGAERAIVQYADAILDRLGGGQLFVQLRQEPAGSPRLLDLVARTTTCDNQLQDVAFLSGSQRFRVAVALSLAIGQYASRQRRPVQAVIIDEGFGCLDALNRQVMVQELQNLRHHLQRILLVSHQDEFAGAFADGYCCELVDGSTRLAPFHR